MLMRRALSPILPYCLTRQGWGKGVAQAVGLSIVGGSAGVVAVLLHLSLPVRRLCLPLLCRRIFTWGICPLDACRSFLPCPAKRLLPGRAMLVSQVPGEAHRRGDA